MKFTYSVLLILSFVAGYLLHSSEPTFQYPASDLLFQLADEAYLEDRRQDFTILQITALTLEQDSLTKEAFLSSVLDLAKSIHQ